LARYAAVVHKSGAPVIERFRHLGRERQSLLIEAAYELALASASVALLPFRRAIVRGSTPLPAAHGRSATIETLVWAVEAAARRLPWRTVCIEQGLAAQRMLRRRGIDARLHYGARNDHSASKLEAHVWVTVDEVPVIGASEAARFAAIATYPQ
jgi:hypothetical protein